MRKLRKEKVKNSIAQHSSEGGLWVSWWELLFPASPYGAGDLCSEKQEAPSPPIPVACVTFLDSNYLCKKGFVYSK